MATSNIMVKKHPSPRLKIPKTLILTHFFPMFPFDPPKNTENQRFSDVFRGIKREH